MSGFLDRLGRRLQCGTTGGSSAPGSWPPSLCVVIAVTLDGQTNDTFRIPGTQSQKALDLLERGSRARPAPPPPSCSRRRRVSTTRRSSPRSGERREPREDPARPSVGNRSPPTNDSSKGNIAIVTVQYDTQAQDLGLDVVHAFSRPRTCGRRGSHGSRTAARSSTTPNKPPSGDADLIGLLAAVIILLFAFGSVVAMGLPILTALFGLGVGISLDQRRRGVHRHRHARAHPRHDDRPRRRDRLLAVHRHPLSREPRRRNGRSKTRSAAPSPPPAQPCSSPACTVVIAICGLADLRHPVRRASSGTWPAIVVAVMMLAALTLLPAIIGAVGTTSTAGGYRASSTTPTAGAPRVATPSRRRGSVGALGDPGRPPRAGRSRSPA